jgi:hypothetical protein
VWEEFFFVITDATLVNTSTSGSDTKNTGKYNTKLHLMLIYYTVIVTSWLSFRKSFNCKYNQTMNYAFFLLTLKSSQKWRSPLFGAWNQLWKLWLFFSQARRTCGTTHCIRQCTILHATGFGLQLAVKCLTWSYIDFVNIQR